MKAKKIAAKKIAAKKIAAKPARKDAKAAKVAALLQSFADAATEAGNTGDNVRAIAVELLGLGVERAVAMAEIRKLLNVPEGAENKVRPIHSGFAAACNAWAYAAKLAGVSKTRAPRAAKETEETGEAEATGKGDKPSAGEDNKAKLVTVGEWLNSHDAGYIALVMDGAVPQAKIRQIIRALEALDMTASKN